MNCTEQHADGQGSQTSSSQAKKRGDRGLDRKALIDKMNNDLRKAYGQVRTAHDEINRVEIPARYEIGRTIAKVMDDPDKYGAKAVAMIAKGLACDKSSLYDAAKVAKTWKPSEFNSAWLCTDATCEWTPSWSHCVELSDVLDPDRRESLREEIYAQHLSVRELKKKIAGSPPVKTEDDARTPRLDRALRQFKSDAETFAARESYWDTHVHGALNVDKNGLATPEMQSLLRDVQTSLLESGRVVRNQLKKIKNYIARVDESPGKPETTPDPVG